jgi:hypothetical protein
MRNNRRVSTGNRVELRADLKALVYQVIDDMELPYVVQNVFEPMHLQDTWAISFFDPTVSIGHQIFQIAIGPVDLSDLSRTRAEVAEKLLKRQSERDGCVYRVARSHPFEY